MKEKETRRRKRLQAMSFQANEYAPIIEKISQHRKLHPGNPFTNKFKPETIERKQREICDLIINENRKYSADAELQWKFKDTKPFFEERRILQQYQKVKEIEERAQEKS